MISNSDAQFFGPKNYLLSPGIETGRQGWSLFNTTLTSKIPTGAITAGAASITTFGSSSTTPLSGDYSLRVASSGAVTAGHGFVSDSFTIDRQDRAKVMGWSFSFEAVSGTMDFSGTSANTWAVYIYDVDGAAWIQPAGVYNLTQSSGVGLASGTFQTTATGTQYRIAVVCITATGGAVEMRLDSFQVGPQKVLQGPSGPVGEIIAFGSLTPPVGFLFCDGTAVSRSNYSDLFKAIGTTYGVGDGSTTFNLPDLRGVFARGAGSQTISGVTFTGTLGSKQVDTLQGHKHIGPVGVTGGAPTNPGNNINAQYANGGAGSTQWDGTGNNVYYTDSSNSPGRGPSVGSETRPANVAVAYHIRYLATYQMSSDTDTRVVAARYKTASATVTGTASVVKFTSADYDTHASYSTSTGLYTVSVSGKYKIAATVFGGATFTAGQDFSLHVYKNGSEIAFKINRQQAAHSNSCSYDITTEVDCNSGDTLAIYVSSNATTPSVGGIAAREWLTIERLSGPATIAASESVGFKATVTTTSVANLATQLMVFSNVVYSTHGAYNASTGVFTAPVSGKYQCNGAISISYIANEDVAGGLAFFKNNVQQSWAGTTKFLVGGDAIVGSVISDVIQLNAGDTLDLRCYQKNASSVSRSPFNGVVNYFSVMRVGN